MHFRNQNQYNCKLSMCRYHKSLLSILCVSAVVENFTMDRAARCGFKFYNRLRRHVFRIIYTANQILDKFEWRVCMEIAVFGWTDKNIYYWFNDVCVCVCITFFYLSCDTDFNVCKIHLNPQCFRAHVLDLGSPMVTNSGGTYIYYQHRYFGASQV